MVVYEPICADNWPAAFTFSQGVKVGNMVFLSGTTATDEKGKIVGPGDIVAQTRQIFKKFEMVLNQVGGSIENIVETTDYVLSLEEYNKTADLRREIFNGPPWPAATGVVVKGLVRPDALIEIKALAVLRD
ncbi:RidA family protein [Sneathiella litorea]|uniref:RidA family protein n=1 Tax=Sneathiella litorea TaxID=2606216 RepID=A0A6L8W7X4_9PROT|nr:RidA family protein [Sneathiella litorea]MZR30749.1 RidA family protein [Sneathiella litorea]